VFGGIAVFAETPYLRGKFVGGHLSLFRIRRFCGKLERNKGVFFSSNGIDNCQPDLIINDWSEKLQ